MMLVTLLLFGVAQMFSVVYSSEEGPAVAELCDELGETRPSMGKRCSCTQANLYFINKMRRKALDTNKVILKNNRDT